jgi:zinc and cadmium transporter
VTTAALGYGLAAAAANLVGALAITLRKRWTVRALDGVLSFAAGFLLCVAFIDLVPEALSRGGRRAAVVVLLSYLLVHLTQHTIGRHFHFGVETHEVSEVVSLSALIGLLLHTFVDGVAVASGVLVGQAMGALVFVAVALHKVPEGLAISSLFLAAGAGRKRAVLAATALGAATLAGVVLTDHVALLQTYGLAMSGGVTIYVGASNLVPEFQAKPGWQTPTLFFAGCAVYGTAHAIAGI